MEPPPSRPIFKPPNQGPVAARWVPRFRFKSMATTRSSVLHGIGFAAALLWAVPAGAVPSCGTPFDAADLQQRVTALRKESAPWLRSLPEPLPAPPRLSLSGTGWLRKTEFFAKQGPVPEVAPPWHSPELDESQWEPCTIPEWNYSGVDRPNHHSQIRWYRRHFAAPKLAGERLWLVFDGADWETEVFLNGEKLGSHLGYFEPFRFEVTGRLRERNVLAVRVKSGALFHHPSSYWAVFPVPDTRDANQGRYTADRAQSTANMRNGDTHCGTGCGIHRGVWIEAGGPVRVVNRFIRASADRSEVRVKLELDSSTTGPVNITATVMPENFEGGTRHQQTIAQALPAGRSTVEFTVPTPGLPAWSPDTPRLHRCRVTITSAGGSATRDDTLIGARSFTMVTEDEAANNPDRPAGMFLLDGRPVFLRGTNIQGLNALWLWGEHERLLEVLLHLKAANFNAVRSCQHVCFPEVLELMDRLGIFSQQDAGCRKLASPELADQLESSVRSLARVTWHHPGVVLLSFANETRFDPTRFVRAALEVDPDRVLNPICGSIHGTSAKPPEGRTNFPDLPDELWRHTIDSIHPYWGWYGRAGEIWRIGENYPPGRMFAIGEYGSEALDAYATMRDHYPSHWKPVPPPTTDTLWGQVQVRKDSPQTRAGFHGRQPSTLADFITASQVFQADQLTELTRSWRLMPRRINAYFQFHFMDVLPANWPKSVLSHDFTPKRGFFAMAQLNQPLAPMCRIAPDGNAADLWIANDRPEPLHGHRLKWSLTAPGQPPLAGERTLDIPASDAVRVTTVDLAAVPPGSDTLLASLEILSPQGMVRGRSRHEFFLRAWREKGAVFSAAPASP